jgi:hypothetical protein
MKNKKLNVMAVEIAADTLGSYNVGDIPIRDKVQFDQLMSADAPDTLQVVVKIKAGRGNKGAGKMYDYQIIRSMAEQINHHLVVGYEGHTKEEDRGYVKREIATYWVGATYDETEQAIYIRGLIAKGFDKLKLELRSGVIYQVSLYGPCSSESVYDNDWNWLYDNVTSLELESIDWTPPGLAGMETEVVSTEMEKGDESGMGLKKVVDLLKKNGFAKEIDAAAAQDPTVDNLVAVIEKALYDLKASAFTPEQQAKVDAFDTVVADLAAAQNVATLTPDEVVAGVKKLTGDASTVTAQMAATEMTQVLEELIAVPEVRDVVREMAKAVVGKPKADIAIEITRIKDLPAIKSMIESGLANNSRGNHTSHKQSNDSIPRRVKQL